MKCDDNQSASSHRLISKISLNSQWPRHVMHLQYVRTRAAVPLAVQYKDMCMHSVHALPTSAGFALLRTINQHVMHIHEVTHNSWRGVLCILCPASWFAEMCKDVSRVILKGPAKVYPAGYPKNKVYRRICHIRNILYTFGLVSITNTLGITGQRRFVCVFSLWRRSSCLESLN